MVPGLFKLRIPDKVMAIVVGAKLFEDGDKLIFIRREIHPRHFIKVGGVEPGRQQGFLRRDFHPWSHLFKARFFKGIYHVLFILFFAYDSGSGGVAICR